MRALRPVCDCESLFLARINYEFLSWSSRMEEELSESREGRAGRLLGRWRFVFRIRVRSTHDQARQSAREDACGSMRMIRNLVTKMHFINVGGRIRGDRHQTRVFRRLPMHRLLQAACKLEHTSFGRRNARNTYKWLQTTPAP